MGKKIAEKEREYKKLTESERDKIKHKILGVLENIPDMTPEDFKRGIKITESA